MPRTMPLGQGSRLANSGKQSDTLKSTLSYRLCLSYTKTDRPSGSATVVTPPLTCSTLCRRSLQGSSAASVQAYMKARYNPIPSRPEMRSGRSLPRPTPTSESNWAYLRAAMLYARGSKSESLKAFQEHGSAYPRSEKHDAVLYMMAENDNGAEPQFCDKQMRDHGQNSFGRRGRSGIGRTEREMPGRELEFGNQGLSRFDANATER